MPTPNTPSTKRHVPNRLVAFIPYLLGEEVRYPEHRTTDFLTPNTLKKKRNMIFSDINVRHAGQALDADAIVAYRDDVRAA